MFDYSYCQVVTRSCKFFLVLQHIVLLTHMVSLSLLFRSILMQLRVQSNGSRTLS
ncbi:hypothetical protein HanHA300_Chr06g0215491 [Helianthus annuus]|nr:hypothetical protein HanHA300_Chr06g0215491 [Helianthus annuus]KAJ0573840.1 hypothetical protein HanHA89_Chr06g0231271 [Helianthus annuus]KAJ0738175.1 hypothetical protein HanLR1_Chr06g0215201 [Helianthus annuus]